jgi:hypothetical protein
MSTNTNDENLYSNLDKMITLLYDYVYLKNVNNYQIKYIDATQMSLIKIKQPTTYDYSNVFNASFKFMSLFPTGLNDMKQVLFKRYSNDSYSSTLRIIPYINPDTRDNLNDPINVNKIIKTLLSELVISDKTTNILLPIMNFDMSKQELKDVSLDNDIAYGSPNDIGLNELSKYATTYDYFSIEITEHYFKFDNLKNYLDKNVLNVNTWFSILYQTADVLYQINILYPGFRHNQFNPEYIEMYYKNDTSLDLIMPEIKISNFFLSQIENLVLNTIISKYNIIYIPTNYSDYFHLLAYLWEHYQEQITVHEELVEFWNEFFPVELRDPSLRLNINKWKAISIEDHGKLDLKNIRQHLSVKYNNTEKKSNDNNIMSNKNKNKYDTPTETDTAYFSTNNSKHMRVSDDYKGAGLKLKSDNRVNGVRYLKPVSKSYYQDINGYPYENHKYYGGKTKTSKTISKGTGLETTSSDESNHDSLSDSSDGSPISSVSQSISSQSQSNSQSQSESHTPRPKNNKKYGSNNYSDNSSSEISVSNSDQSSVSITPSERDKSKKSHRTRNYNTKSSESHNNSSEYTDERNVNKNSFAKLFGVNPGQNMNSQMTNKVDYNALTTPNPKQMQQQNPLMMPNQYPDMPYSAPEIPYPPEMAFNPTQIAPNDFSRVEAMPMSMPMQHGQYQPPQYPIQSQQYPIQSQQYSMQPQQYPIQPQQYPIQPQQYSMQPQQYPMQPQQYPIQSQPQYQQNPGYNPNYNTNPVQIQQNLDPNQPVFF